jgi:hypothetical protein
LTNTQVEEICGVVEKIAMELGGGHR